MARGRGRGRGRGTARQVKCKRVDSDGCENEGDLSELQLEAASFVCSKCKCSFDTQKLADGHVLRAHYGLVGVNSVVTGGCVVMEFAFLGPNQ